MKEAYYLSVRSGIVNSHLLHKGNCPFLRRARKKLFIGHMDSPGEAYREGTRLFRKVDKCVFCMKSPRHDETNVLPAELVIHKKFLNTGFIKQDWESALICCRS